MLSIPSCGKGQPQCLCPVKHILYTAALLLFIQAAQIQFQYIRSDLSYRVQSHIVTVKTIEGNAEAFLLKGLFHFGYNAVNLFVRIFRNIDI